MQRLVRKFHILIPRRIPIVRILCTLMVFTPVIMYWSILADETRESRLVCLMYHRFVTPDEFASCDATQRLYSITPERFESHLQRLHDEGYQIVSLDEALSLIHGNSIAATKPVLITIDDGCESIQSVAEPILKKMNGHATVFVTTDRSSYVFQGGELAQDRLSDKELCDLDSSVFDLGTHGMTHRPMSALDDRRLEQELMAPKKYLSRLVGRPVQAMAVPGNWHSPRVEDFAEKAGYRAVFVSDPGSIHSGQDPIGLPRLNVSGTMDADRLMTAISPAGMSQRRLGWTINQFWRNWFGSNATIETVLHTYAATLLSANGAVAIVLVIAIWVSPLLAGITRRRRVVLARALSRSNN
jgi:peptidoglycan/xylan/chitin deacetylase (PgdA/CDA1 family)